MTRHHSVRCEGSSAVNRRRCRCSCKGVLHGGAQEDRIGDAHEDRRAARFTISHDTPGEPLVIRDIGGAAPRLSVTNDAERVVGQLVAEGRLPSGRRLFYYDSDGQLDEILVESGRFVGFAPLPRGEVA